MGELPATPCATGEAAADSGTLALTPTAARCADIPIVLDGRELETGAAYLGWLDISQESGARHRGKYIVTRAAANRAAVPVLTGTLVGSATCVLGCKPRVTLTLKEQTGNVGLRALAIRPASTEASELASSAKLRVGLFRESGATPPADAGEFWNRAVATDLWNLDREDAADVALRSLAAGDQATLVFEPAAPLRPGEYKVKIQVEADNATPQDRPTIELTFRVSQRRWVPFFILVGSVLLSYWISRGVGLHQRHRRLIESVKELNSRGEEKAYTWNARPIVQLRAELSLIRIALDRSGKLFRWVSAPADLEARLAVAEKRLPALEQLVNCRDYWATSTQESDWVRRRANRFLREVVRILAETPNDAEFSAEAIETLADLRRWEDPAQLPERYWLHLKADILRLKSTIVLRSYPGPNTEHLRGILGPLLDNFGKLDAAVAALNGLRNEIADAAANGKDVAALQKVIGIDPERIRALGAELATSGDLLAQVELKGLEALQDAAEKAHDLATGTPLENLWRNVAATKQQLAVIRPANPDGTDAAAGLVEKLGGMDDDWLANGLDALLDGIRAAQATPREQIRAILTGLNTEQLPADIEEAIDRERRYAALKLVWEHRAVAALDADRLAVIEDRQDIEVFFRKIDDWAWGNLKDKLEISRPRAERMLEELRLIEFRISPEKEEHGRNFLFKHGLRYQWDIYVGTPPEHLRTVETQEPCVVQFIPRAYDKVEMKAQAFRPLPSGAEEESTVREVVFSTRKSDELRWRKSFQRGELVALVVAVLVAVVTGMMADVFEATLLGSFKSYLALAVWGIASERGTKLLKDFDTYAGR